MVKKMKMVLAGALLVGLSQQVHAAPIVTGSVAMSSASDAVNLTTEGTTDWSYWGVSTAVTNVNDIVQEASKNVTSQIGGLKNINVVGGYGAYLTDPSLTSPPATGPTFSWSDGAGAYASNTGTAFATMKDMGQYPWGSTGGFTFDVTASATPQILKVYVGAAGGVGTFTASYGSTVMYTDASLTETTAWTGKWGGKQAVYSLTFSNDNPSPVPLTITWTTSHTTNMYHYGHPVIDAATLAPIPEPASLGLAGIGVLAMMMARGRR